MTNSNLTSLHGDCKRPKPAHSCRPPRAEKFAMACHYTRWPAILYGHLRCRFGKNSLWLAGAGRLSVAVHFCPRRASDFRYFVLFNIRGCRGTGCFCHRIVNILGWRGQARCSQSGTAAARRRVPKNILVKHPNQPCFAQPAPSRPDEGSRPRSTNHMTNTETDKRLGTEGKGAPNRASLSATLLGL